MIWIKRFSLTKLPRMMFKRMTHWRSSLLQNKAHLPPYFSPFKVQSNLFDAQQVLLKHELSCDDYIGVFNKLMGAGTYCFEYSRRPSLKIFNNLYMFKKGGVESTLESSQPKYCTKFWWSSLGDKDSLYELLIDVGLEPLGFEDKSSLRGEVLMHSIKG